MDIDNTDIQSLLDGLNPEQRAAVNAYGRSSLILAGAGSGKTRVLTCRIAYMLHMGIKPESVMALTFTNKAAGEMRERVRKACGPAASGIWMGTFHSVFARILRSEAEHIGFGSSFTIYDQSQSQGLIKSIIRERNLNEDTYRYRDVHARISKAKNSLWTPERYAANEAMIRQDRERKQPEFNTVYSIYQARCKANNAMDFDDLLLYTNILLKDCPDVLSRYSERFRYILVDEYQDTNFAQYSILRRLSAPESVICVVGDDAQSIYSFRGARVENILSFTKDYPGAALFRLERNYRSTQTIVNAANALIGHNQRRLDKHCVSNNSVGERISVRQASVDREEARMIADAIRLAGYASGGKWSGSAVLYRNNAQSRTIEEALKVRGIPYRILSGHTFYDRKEIKDFLAYCKVIVNPQDDESLRRIINVPARGIGEVTVERLAAQAAAEKCHMWDILERIHLSDGHSKGPAARLDSFAGMMADLMRDIPGMGLYDAGHAVLGRSGLLSSLSSSSDPEDAQALGNLEELVNSMHDMDEELAQEGPDGTVLPKLSDMLQHISLMTDGDREETGEKVSLMTVHSAKGLEFDHVHIAGMEERLFPSAMAASSPNELEEERRLFYVAITRARERVFIYHCQNRRGWDGEMHSCTLSRFVREIPDRFIDSDTDRWGDDSPRPAAHAVPRKSPERGADTRHSSFRPRESINERPMAPLKAPDVSKMRSIGARRADSPAGCSESGSFRVGSRVRSARFGEGVVLSSVSDSKGEKVKVRFRDFGEKTLLTAYAGLEMIGDEKE